MTKKNILVLTGVVLFLGLQAAEVWQIFSLRKRVADTEWSIALNEKSSEDTVEPTVGTIQFLRRGYSIEFESVKYTADGLVLSGSVGNPTNLTLNTLTLKFTATKPLYEYREEFRKDEFSLLFGPTPIGEAQTATIPFLAPKAKAPFEVTIPNVKQTKEGVRVRLAFTGERYSYGF